MALEAADTEQDDDIEDKATVGQRNGSMGPAQEDPVSEITEEEDEEDEEPRLKYVSLTRHLGSLYRNGDATSAFMVAGDKMVGGWSQLGLAKRRRCGTH